MKFKLAALPDLALLYVHPSQTTALRCGLSWITEPCIGDTDKRYDPAVKYDLVDQSDFFKTVEGLYEGKQYAYGYGGAGSVDSDALEPRRLHYIAGIGPYYRFYTVCGSRFI